VGDDTLLYGRLIVYLWSQDKIVAVKTISLNGIIGGENSNKSVSYNTEEKPDKVNVELNYVVVSLNN
jgi:uncharacterized protein (UPF0333 family)